MNLSNGLVYLAGGIAGLSGPKAIDWREYAKTQLNLSGLDVRDPMRAKKVMLGEQSISRSFHDYKTRGPFFTSRGIMTRDFNDVKQASCLLVNLLGSRTPSLGTIMELAWAYALQIPAVVCIEDEGNPHDNHPMIHEAMPFRVTTLDDGIEAVITILEV